MVLDAIYTPMSVSIQLTMTDQGYPSNELHPPSWCDLEEQWNNKRVTWLSQGLSSLKQRGSVDESSLDYSINIFTANLEFFGQLFGCLVAASIGSLLTAR